MSKELNRLYNRAVKKGVAISKNYTYWNGDKMEEPEEKYRIEISDRDGVKTTELYHYETLTLSVEKKDGKYIVKDLYGQSVSDRDSIQCVLALATGSKYSPLGITYRTVNGGFGLVDRDFNYYMQDDYDKKQDFINKANELLKA